jgi:hypothetical protein
MEPVGNHLFRRSLAVGVSVLYALTNVFLAHAGESAFWGERRRAIKNRTISSSLKSNPLYASLPGGVSLALPSSLRFEVGVAPLNPADKTIVQSYDPRVRQIAQSVLPFGTVRFFQKSNKPKAPLVIHIQDVHGNLDAQQNIGEMVLALARDQGVRVIGLEGAWGPFATDEFRPYPNQDIVKRVGRYFLKKDLISGAEYAGLASETPLTLWGIEDPALYRANVDAVKQSLAGQVPAEKFLASLTRELDSLKKTHYSPPLLAFDENQSLYDQNRRGLGEYLQTLVVFDGRDRTDLTVHFPNVVRILSALNEERALDFAEVERERQDLVKALSATLSPGELQTLIHHSVDLRAGTLSNHAYHIYLRDLCARKGVALGKRPTLLAYMHYVAASEEIKRDALLSEMKTLETAAHEALIKTSRQRNLVDLSRDTLRLKKLIANELTPEEWADYTTHRGQILRMTDRLITQFSSKMGPGPDLPTLLAPFEAFCARAMDRNRVLTENVLSQVKVKNQSVAVLVAGGFHTEGLVKDLQKKETSVLVLTPTIGTLDPNHRYLDVFAQDPIPLEKIFTGEPIALKTLCALSEHAPNRSVLNALHLGIVAISLTLKERSLRTLLKANESIVNALQQFLDELSRQVGPLAGLKLAVAMDGGGAINMQLQNENDRFLLHMEANGNGNGEVKVLVQREHSKKHQMAQPLPMGEGTLHHAETKFLYSPRSATALLRFLSLSPFLLFFFLYARDSGLSLLYGGAGAFILSVTLLGWANVLARHPLKTKGKKIVPTHPGFDNPLVDALISEYHSGTSSQHTHHNLPREMSLEKIHLKFDKIAQEVIKEKIKNTPLIENGFDGTYQIFFAPKLNVLVKIPPERSQNTRERYDAIKKRLGGVFTAMTQIDFLFIEGKRVFSNAIVQEAVWRIPNEQEKWPPNGHIPAAYDFFEGTTSKSEIIEHNLTRKKRLGDFEDILNFHHHVTFRNGELEDHLALTAANRLVLHQLAEVVLGNVPTDWSARVPDVFENKIRDAQRAYLNSLFIETAKSIKPHSGLSVSTVDRFLLWVGLSESKTTFWAKGIVIIGIPIFETMVYGWGTPVLSAFLSSIPWGVGFSPVFVGFISAVVHVILWRLQGEKVYFRDFVSWWAMGSQFSLPFEMFSPHGWAGELPWIMSGFSHFYINWFIVSGAAQSLGSHLRIPWLEQLKPGSVLSNGDGLNNKQLFSLRRSVFEAINKFFPEKNVKDASSKNFDLEENGRLYHITFGSGEEFDGWIRTQLTTNLLVNEEGEPIKIIDFGIEENTYSYLVTERVNKTHTAPPVGKEPPAVELSEAELVKTFTFALISRLEKNRPRGFNKSDLAALVNQIYPDEILQAKTENLPTKSLMATAGAVAVVALSNPKIHPWRLKEYLEAVKSFQEILAIQSNITEINKVYTSCANRFGDKSELNLKEHYSLHEAYVDFMNAKNPQGDSPVPLISPWELKEVTQREISLEKLLLNGGRKVGLDHIFRTYRPSGKPQDLVSAEKYKSFIRQRVRENWNGIHTKETWLATLPTEEGDSVGLGVAQARLGEANRRTLRWWALAELWLAVADAGDWFNWRYYVVLFRERSIFGMGNGFSSKDRLNRATVYAALLRAAQSAVLTPSYKKYDNEEAQTFDIDLLLGAMSASEKRSRPLIEPLFKTYNQLLEKSTQIDFWRDLVNLRVFNLTRFPPSQPPQQSNGGVLLFDVDAFLPGSGVNEQGQQDMALALEGVLLATNNQNLKEKVFLVSTKGFSQGEEMDASHLANLLVKQYGELFDRVKNLRVISPGDGNEFCSTLDGDHKTIIHLSPLLRYLNINQTSGSIQFWTHDERRVEKEEGLEVQIMNILSIANTFRQFFEIQTFLQTNA